ncbi:MAG: RICIN domain-containing protein [Chthoniobacterales bacterium]
MKAIISVASRAVVDAHRPDIGSNGTRVHQYDYLGNLNQKWRFDDVGDGFVVIRNVESGRVLDVHRPDIHRNGARVHLWDYLGAPNQQWRLEEVAGNEFVIRNRESNRVLDLHAYDVSKKAGMIQQWEHHGDRNQRWSLADDPWDAKILIGPFSYDPAIPFPHVLTLHERYTHAFTKIAHCDRIGNEKQRLREAFARDIWTGITHEPNVNARARIGGRQIWVNFDILFPQGPREIAQTLIHELMHSAGYTHPNRQPSDRPGDNGPYYGTPPLQAEICIAGIQSFEVTADSTSCFVDGETCSIITTENG